MELYHQTLLSSNNHKLCLALHAYPIKPKEEYERPRQLLLATTNSLQLYRPQPGLAYKHDLRLIHEESLFSSICAMEAVVYQDDDLRKDIVLVTLANGKYQLLEWIPNKTQFAVIDQNLIFSDEQEITSGLVKPTPGTTHMIQVTSSQSTRKPNWCSSPLIITKLVYINAPWATRVFDFPPSLT